jgi:hypothetical protein
MEPTLRGQLIPFRHIEVGVDPFMKSVAALKRGAPTSGDG